MKKLISLVMAFLLVGASFTMYVNALDITTFENSNVVSETIEELNDGYILETTISVEESGISTYATKTVTGTKNASLKNADGDVLWTFTLRGTFSVNTGVSATCTAVSYSTSNIASGWSLDSVSTSKSGNKAMADFVFKHKVLFVTTQTVDKSLTLTCSSDGTLS